MPLKTFDEYVALAEQAHGHICAGQILGLRMALYGLNLLDLDDPLGQHRKRLVTFIEIDRCATDAIPVVTGCRLGKRALKFRDFGKVAATFCDLEADRAVRVVALEDSKQRAREMFPEIADQERAADARLSRDAGCGAVRRRVGARARSARKNFPATRRRAWFARSAAKASISSAKWCATDACSARPAPASAITKPL